jgi:hypothetical protein
MRRDPRRCIAIYGSDSPIVGGGAVRVRGTDFPEGRLAMSISSISSIPASFPVKAPDPVSAQTSNAPSDNTQNGSDSDDAAAAQPAVQAPLPPGQGTRIDQLV